MRPSYVIILILFLLGGARGRVEAAAVDPSSDKGTPSATAVGARPTVDPMFPDPTLLIQLLPKTMHGPLKLMYDNLLPASKDPLNFWCGMASDLATKLIGTTLLDQICIGLKEGPYRLDADPLDELNSYPASFFAGWNVVGLHVLNMAPAEAEGGGSIFGTGLGLLFLALEHPITKIRLGCIGTRDKQPLRTRLINSALWTEGGVYEATQAEIARRLRIMLSNYTDKLPELLSHLGFDADVTQNLKGFPHTSEAQTSMQGQMGRVITLWDSFVKHHKVDAVAGHGLPGLIASTYAIAHNRIVSATEASAEVASAEVASATAAKKLCSRVYGTPLSEGNLVDIFTGILKGEAASAFETSSGASAPVVLTSEEVSLHKAFCSKPIFDLVKAPVGPCECLPSWRDITETLKPIAMQQPLARDSTKAPSVSGVLPATAFVSVDGSGAEVKVLMDVPASSSAFGDASGGARRETGWVDVDLGGSVALDSSVAARSSDMGDFMDPSAFKNASAESAMSKPAEGMLSRIVLNPLSRLVSPVAGAVVTYVGPSVSTVAGYVGSPVAKAKGLASALASPVAAVVGKASTYVVASASAVVDTIRVGDVTIRRLLDGGFEITVAGGATVISTLGSFATRVSAGALDMVKEGASAVMAHLPLIGGGAPAPLTPFVITRETGDATNLEATIISTEKQVDDIFGLDGLIHLWMRIYAYNNAPLAAAIIYALAEEAKAKEGGKAIGAFV